MPSCKSPFPFHARVSPCMCHPGFIQVLARRALVLRLWKELYLVISNSKQSPLRNPDGGRSYVDAEAIAGLKPKDLDSVETEPLLYAGAPVDNGRMLLLLEPTARGAWRLKRSLRLHLYVSDPPCGDASIFEQFESRRGALELSSSANDPPTSCPNLKGEIESGHIETKSLAEPSTAGYLDSSMRAYCRVRQEGGSQERGERSSSGEEFHKGGDKCCCCYGGSDQSTKLSKREDESGRSDRMTKRHRCNALDEPGARAPSTSSSFRQNFGDDRDGVVGQQEKMTFTGAKIIAAVKERGAIDQEFDAADRLGKTAGELVLRIDREQEQTLGALRIKSSRSNISEGGRTMSMSCSDKLAKWAVLGVQVRLMAVASDRSQACVGLDRASVSMLKSSSV